MFMFGSVNFYENSGGKIPNKTKCTAWTGLCCILAQSLGISSNLQTLEKDEEKKNIFLDADFAGSELRGRL